jgi:hypothetical protein
MARLPQQQPDAHTTGTIQPMTYFTHLV